ncbi:MAG: hypothetical protein ACT4PE_03040 [Candidatus Eiseniibacteriota bacterium]
MNRAFVAVLSILATSGPSRAQFAEASWWLSGSTNSAGINVEPPFVGEHEIYLWQTCQLGVEWIEADFDIVGSLEIVSVTPLLGVTNIGTLPNVHLQAPSCMNQNYQILVATIVVRDPTGAGGNLCFAGANQSLDCGSYGNTWSPHGYRGYSTDGSMPCEGSLICAIDIALPETWGRVKAQFAR